VVVNQMSPEMALAVASLTASLHAHRILINNGMVSPDEAESVLDAVTRMLERLPDNLSGEFISRYDPMFAAMRQAAKDNWKSQ
jgi:predicted AlkP superfamily phosphohydrolase/phosphomutase